MTKQELKDRFPNASSAFLKANATVLRVEVAPELPKARKRRQNASNEPPSLVLAHGSAPGSKPEHDIQARTLAAAQAEAGHPAFYVVRVTSYRTRLLDTDNLIPKWHVDALRYAGVLPSDAPDRCQIVTTQKKVATRLEERTEIRLEVA